VISLEGRVCVVTGASSGIGRAVAIALVRAGAHVWAVGRSRDRLDALALEADGPGSAEPLVLDLELDGELADAAVAIMARADAIDALVHSAGAIRLGSLESLSASDLDHQYVVNLRAPFVLTKLLLPALRRARGQVVFVNSSFQGICEQRALRGDEGGPQGARGRAAGRGQPRRRSCGQRVRG
jgi:NAD(P)-dependent dehydrogenase (short-subunit alcohol dehydrogenase family)